MKSMRENKVEKGAEVFLPDEDGQTPQITDVKNNAHGKAENAMSVGAKEAGLEAKEAGASGVENAGAKNVGLEKADAKRVGPERAENAGAKEADVIGLEKTDAEKGDAQKRGFGRFFSGTLKRFKEKKEKKILEIENSKLSAEENRKVEEKLVEAGQEVRSSGEKKKKIRNIILFVFNIALVVGILVWNILDSGEDFSPLNIKNVNFVFFLVVVLLLGVIVFVDVLSVHRMVYRKTFRSRWHTSYKALSVLRYYDAITPLATGGQPFMVTYLTSRDVPASTALSIPIAKLVFQKFAWLSVTLVCLIISFTKGMGAFVSSASIIGYLLALILTVAILFVSFSKKLGKKLVDWGLKLLVKLRLVKNYEKCHAKVMGVVEDYQNIMKEYGKSKLDVLYLVVLHAIRIVCIYSLPYLIYLIFPFGGGKVGNFGDFFIFAALIDLASSFIPLPGGTGMNEITFTAIFKDYFLGNTFWALLIWRFCTYYFYLLQGIGVITYDTVYGNRKYRWVKKSRALREEGQVFKRTQIENFRKEREKRRKSNKIASKQ